MNTGQILQLIILKKYLHPFNHQFFKPIDADFATTGRKFCNLARKCKKRRDVAKFSSRQLLMIDSKKPQQKVVAFLYLDTALRLDVLQTFYSFTTISRLYKVLQYSCNLSYFVQLTYQSGIIACCLQVIVRLHLNQKVGIDT